MKILEIPRLTGSLRAFSGLSSPSQVSDANEGDILVRKRKIRAKKQREGELTWTELKTAVQDCIVDDRNAKTEVSLYYHADLILHALQ